MACEKCWGQDFPGCKNCDPEWVDKESLNRKVSECTMAELFDLMVKAVKECKRQDAEAAEAEYQKLTGGKVPKEY